VAITGSNPLSTQDDVAAALAETGVYVYAWRGVTAKDYGSNLERVLDTDPDILIDDGAELSIAAHQRGKAYTRKVIGACEETTTGVMRLKGMDSDRWIIFYVLAVTKVLTIYL